MLNLRAVDRAFDAERYVMSVTSDVVPSGPNLIVRCPRCEKQKLWVLIVDRDNVRAPAWQCFSIDCGARGHTAMSLVRHMEDCDTFHALELIMKFQKGNEPIIDLRRLVEDRLQGKIELWAQPPVPVPLPSEFIAYGRDMPRLPYFVERGIGPKKASRYGIGWCDDGYFRDRMIIPVYSGDDVVFFVARYMKKTPPLCKADKLPCTRCGGSDKHKRIKKTIYPKGAKPGHYLFNYDAAKNEPVIRIVEGALDAVALGKSAVATFGTSLSQYQLELLMRTAAKEIVIAWDPDAIDKARELADRLADIWRVRVVELPTGTDPDEISRDDFAELEARSPALDTSGARREYVISRLERRA